MVCTWNCVLISCVSEVVVKLAVKVAFTSETSQNLTTVKKGKGQVKQPMELYPELKFDNGGTLGF